ncbi:MAG: restriction endonuclease subunit S [Paludibacteraceae bacterium]|nr:restriction endonuclease subunit S [Paludibacteraceae bacterium]
MGKWVKKKLGEGLVDRICTGKLDANAMVDGGLYRFYTCAKDYTYIDDYAFDDEALLISGNGEYVGYVHYYRGKFNAYQRTYVLRGFSIDVKYLQSYLNCFLRDRIKKEMNAGSIPFIKMGTLTDMYISYPSSLSEQRRIASILSSADKVIDSTQKLIAKYKQIKQGMMEDLLKPKEGWKKVKLGEVGDFYVGGDVDKNSYSPYPTIDCKFPIYANALVREGIYGYSSKYEFDKEAVTITGRGDVGKVFYRAPYFSTIIRLITLIPNDSEINVRYLSYAMSRINFIIESTGVPQLTAPQAKMYEVFIPDFSEQCRIASILSSIDKKIESEEKVLYKYKNIKKGLMEKLLRGEES